MKLGVTVHRVHRSQRSSRGSKNDVPSAFCSQCRKAVKRCSHTVAYYDSDRYAPCGCRTHVHPLTREPCTVVEYLDGKVPGSWRWSGHSPDGISWWWYGRGGRPTVRCLNCGDEWPEPIIGKSIGRAKAWQ